jgi:ketosteroid isomerase-like protein
VSVHPNELLARRLWEATSRGDAVALARIYAPDVVWRSYGNNPFSGEHKGVGAVLDLLARAGEDVDELRSEALDFYASERGAAIHYRTTADRGPKHMESENVLLLSIEGGLVARVAAIPVDAPATDAFWRVE